MYSSKPNINILTAYLAAYGIEDAVVCPGSRNAPIVHNLNEHPGIRCHAVTDERSAGFYALGIALKTEKPVAVCVTSGSAVLNLAPAVGEAKYRHVPLIVISADRPPQWIGQLDGQTIDQSNALRSTVRKVVNLPEPATEEEEWYCHRLVAEALHTATCHDCGPVHINVPITEPLFDFCTPSLPNVKSIVFHHRGSSEAPVWNYSPFNLQKPDAETDERTLIVIGQTRPNTIPLETLCSLAARFVVFAEPLSVDAPAFHFDEAIRLIPKDEIDLYRPHRIVYIGDTIVSKVARKFLRDSHAEVCMVTLDASEVCDPLMGITDIVECQTTDDVNRFLLSICNDTPLPRSQQEYIDRWDVLFTAADARTTAYSPVYSQMEAVRLFEQTVESLNAPIHVHYANSNAVRLANIYANHYVWCNRGVNGIEGSLSTAAGFSLATDDEVAIVIGDLSFFYDQNALWNQELRGNLRILLINNSQGGIFRMLRGLDDSPAALPYISAEHHTTAEGICRQSGISYLTAHNSAELARAIPTLLAHKSTRPVLLEVFTDANTDTAAYKEYFKTNSRLQR